MASTGRSTYGKSFLPFLAVAVLGSALLAAPLSLETQLAGALLLFVVLPGWLFVQAAFNRQPPSLFERLLLALGCGYTLAILLGLALQMLGGPLGSAQILAGAGLLNAGLAAAAWIRRAAPWPRPGRPDLAALLVCVVAVPLRSFNLGYSEFQGDEAKVLLRAAALLQGAPDSLLAHRKPPGEILLLAIFAGGLDRLTELSGRLPFALAGVLGVLACYQLGRASFGPRAGLIAGLLLAVNGYWVAFGRILQYQSVGLLLDALAVLCLLRFGRGGGSERAYAVAGGLLLLGSGLTALSAVFLLPVAAVALWPVLRGSRRVAGRSLLLWLWPLALLVPAALLIGLRLAGGAGQDGTLRSIWGYLGPRLGEGRPYFNLDGLLIATNLYTSSLYLLVVLGAGSLILVGALLRPARRPLAWRLALTWLAAPLLTHLLLVRVVATHWRELFPGLLLLVGSAAATSYADWHDRRVRWLAALAGGLFLAASAHYVWVAWIQPWPEYQLQYPLYRHPLDWSGQQIRGAGGTFGAVRLHGWKAVAELMAREELPTSYATNERPAEAAWYLRRRQVCAEQAALFIRAPTTPRDRQAIESGEPLPGYTLTGRVLVAGHPGLALYLRQPRAAGPRDYPAEAFGEQFDHELSQLRLPIGTLYRPSIDVLPSCGER